MANRAYLGMADGTVVVVDTKEHRIVEEFEVPFTERVHSNFNDM